MMPSKRLFLCLPLACAAALGLAAQAPASDPGAFLDLRVKARDFSQGALIDLSAPWDFWWSELIAPETIALGQARAPDARPAMPSYWNNMVLRGAALPPRGAATYHLRLALPDSAIYGLSLRQMVSAYALYANGELIAANGRVASDPARTSAEFRPLIVYASPRDGILDLVLHVSNAAYRNGGMWQPIKIGLASPIANARENDVRSELFLLGAIAVIGLYNLALYAFRPKNRTPLWFGLFCLIVASRLAATGHILLSNAWPGFPWSLQIRMELSPFYLGAMLFGLFFRELFPREVKVKAIRPMLIVFGAFSLAAILAPIGVVSRMVLPMEIAALFGLLYLLGTLGLACSRGRSEAWILLGGFLFFFATAVNDILYSNTIIRSAYLLPTGLFIFIFTQAFVLARVFSKSFTQVEHLSDHLTRTNLSLERFVPQEFLSYLDRQSIVDVQLGDQTLREMTILFSDIRSFTAMSERMTPQENFNFLNALLERLGPIVRDRGGFVDKYIGDGIMALFPECPDDAVAAAVDMQKAVAAFNEEAAGRSMPKVRVGIGIHVGPLMLGIIGERLRLESTVISDTVNLASRIQNLTKYYRADILVSGDVVARLREPGRFALRMVDRVTVKGKSKPCAVHEALDSRDSGFQARALEGRESLALAVERMHARRFDEALAILDRLASDAPDDQTVAVINARCAEFKRAGANGVPDQETFQAS